MIGTPTPLPPKQLAIVSAGLSLPSATRLLADRLAAATTRGLAEHGVMVETTNIDLREVAQDIVTHMVRGFSTEELAAQMRRLSDADGAILVTPIFTSSFSGLFKSFLDILDPKALNGLPVILAATGGSDRHSLALDYAIRPVFAYLRARPVPTAVFASTADWGRAGEVGSAALSDRIDRAGGELGEELLRPAPDNRDRVRDPLTLPEGFDPSGGL